MFAKIIELFLRMYCVWIRRGTSALHNIIEKMYSLSIVLCCWLGVAKSIIQLFQKIFW